MHDTEMLKEIGQRLRTQRINLQLSQERAAELLDMSVVYYGNIERGKKCLSLEKVLLVYKKMKLPPQYLLLGKEITDSESRIDFDEWSEGKMR